MHVYKRFDYIPSAPKNISNGDQYEEEAIVSLFELKGRIDHQQELLYVAHQNIHDLTRCITYLNGENIRYRRLSGVLTFIGWALTLLLVAHFMLV